MTITSQIQDFTTPALTGTQDITISGFGDVAAGLIVVNIDTDTDVATEVPNISQSIGLFCRNGGGWDNHHMYILATDDADTSGSVVAVRGHGIQSCIRLREPSTPAPLAPATIGAVTAAATDGITITYSQVSGIPAQGFVMFWGDTEISSDLTYMFVPGPLDITFKPDILIGMGSITAGFALDNNQNFNLPNIQQGFGIAIRDPDTDAVNQTSRVYEIRGNNPALGQLTRSGSTRTPGLGMVNTGLAAGTQPGWLEVASFDATGYTTQLGGIPGSNPATSVMALKFGPTPPRQYLITVQSPAVGNTQLYFTNFQPQSGICLWGSGQAFVSTVDTDSESSSHSIGVWDDRVEAGSSFGRYNRGSSVVHYDGLAPPTPTVLKSEINDQFACDARRQSGPERLRFGFGAAQPTFIVQVYSSNPAPASSGFVYFLEEDAGGGVDGDYINFDTLPFDPIALAEQPVSAPFDLDFTNLPFDAAAIQELPLLAPFALDFTNLPFDAGTVVSTPAENIDFDNLPFEAEVLAEQLVEAPFILPPMAQIPFDPNPLVEPLAEAPTVLFSTFPFAPESVISDNEIFLAVNLTIDFTNLPFAGSADLDQTAAGDYINFDTLPFEAAALAEQPVAAPGDLDFSNLPFNAAAEATAEPPLDAPVVNFDNLPFEAEVLAEQPVAAPFILPSEPQLPFAPTRVENIDNVSNSDLLAAILKLDKVTQVILLKVLRNC